MPYRSSWFPPLLKSLWLGLGLFITVSKCLNPTIYNIPGTIYTVLKIVSLTAQKEYSSIPSRCCMESHLGFYSAFPDIGNYFPISGIRIPDIGKSISDIGKWSISRYREMIFGYRELIFRYREMCLISRYREINSRYLKIATRQKQVTPPSCNTALPWRNCQCWFRRWLQWCRFFKKQNANQIIQSAYGYVHRPLSDRLETAPLTAQRPQVSCARCRPATATARIRESATRSQQLDWQDCIRHWIYCLYSPQAA